MRVSQQRNYSTNNVVSVILQDQQIFINHHKMENYNVVSVQNNYSSSLSTSAMAPPSCSLQYQKSVSSSSFSSSLSLSPSCTSFSLTFSNRAISATSKIGPCSSSLFKGFSYVLLEMDFHMRSSSHHSSSLYAGPLYCTARFG
jgi:hypothetical protein